MELNKIQQESKTEKLNVTALLCHQIDELCEVLGKHGFTVKGYNQAATEKFESLPAPLQMARFTAFTAYKNAIVAAAEMEIDLRDELELLKCAAKSLRFIIPEDVFEKVEKDDIVEIYNSDFIQVYRSISFMDVCNYTLLDLLSHEFYELYERSTAVNQKCFEAVQAALDSGQLKPMNVTPIIPNHLMRERFSEKRGTFIVSFRTLCPVHTWPSTNFGFIVLQKVKRLPPGTESDLIFL